MNETDRIDELRVARQNIIWRHSQQTVYTISSTSLFPFNNRERFSSPTPVKAVTLEQSLLYFLSPTILLLGIKGSGLMNDAVRFKAGDFNSEKVDMVTFEVSNSIGAILDIRTIRTATVDSLYEAYDFQILASASLTIRMNYVFRDLECRLQGRT